MHYKLTARRVIHVRCGRIMPSIIRPIEELVQLIKISGRLRAWGSNDWGFGLGELSIRRRYIGLLFFFFFFFQAFGSVSFGSVSFFDVKRATETETEDNDGGYSPANDCCDRFGRSRDIRFNLGPCISRK